MSTHASSMSRRHFTRSAALLATMVAAPRMSLGSSPVTARNIVELIRSACRTQGIEWAKETVDTFKIGDPDVPVSGIVSTFTGSLDIMQRAVDAGANFIISHEPIFYNHLDDTAALQERNDPVYNAKRQFAEQHGLTVWRFHDHLHRISPEPVTTALYQQLGWEPYLEQGKTGFGRRIDLPETTLGELARTMARRLPTASIRVIGDRSLKVQRVGLAGHSIGGLINSYADCDVGLAAEIREWDAGEYARDALELGMPKALIMIAHERGEQDGMALFVDWLRDAVDNRSPVTFISSGEPFRTL